MHDVMSLDPPSSPSPSWEKAAGEDGKAFPPVHVEATSQKQSFLREWHRRGNPFRVIGESVGASIAGDSEAVAVEGEGMLAGVGLGRLPSGTDVDDDPDLVGRGGGAAAGADAGGKGARGRGEAIQEQLEAEEKRCVCRELGVAEGPGIFVFCGCKVAKFTFVCLFIMSHADLFCLCLPSHSSRVMSDRERPPPPPMRFTLPVFFPDVVGGARSMVL